MHQFTMVAQGFDLSIIQLHVLEVCLELHRRGLRSKTKLAASPDTEESEIVVEQIESLVKICENMWTLWTDYLMLAVWTPFSRNIGYIFAIYIYIYTYLQEPWSSSEVNMFFLSHIQNFVRHLSWYVVFLHSFIEHVHVHDKKATPSSSFGGKFHFVVVI